MRTAYLGIGSNQGDRHAHLQAAVEGMQARDALRVLATSPVYETEAHTLHPEEEQSPYLNAVVEVEVDCSPKHLLRLAQKLEREEGRQRDGVRWAPRPLDVDLLVVGAVVRHTEELILPHPRLAERRFVLVPWADLAPNLMVPAPFEASVQELLDACTDSSAVRRTRDVLPASILCSPSRPNGQE